MHIQYAPGVVAFFTRSVERTLLCYGTLLHTGYVQGWDGGLLPFRSKRGVARGKLVGGRYFLLISPGDGFPTEQSLYLEQAVS
jgi:hypothetical protein